MRNIDYAKHVYEIVRLDCEGMDAIYKDYIIQMVGVYGFNALYEHKLIEGCGTINGRQLYVLCQNKQIDNVKEMSEIEALRKENKKLKDFLLKGF